MATVTSLAAALVGFGATPAAAALVSDVGVTLVGRPASVAPSGGHVRYEGTIRNNGVVAIDVNFTDTSTGGTVQPALSSIPAGCSLSGNSMTCGFTLLFNEARSFAIDLKTNVSTVPYTASNHAQINATAPADEDASNNNVTVNTPVSNDSSGSVAFVPGGASLQFKAHTLTVPSSSPGLFVNLNDATVAPNTSCGGGLKCAPTGLHVGIVQDDTYKAIDVNNPVKVEVVFGPDPCNGMTPDKCTGLSWRHLATGPAVLINPCASPGVAFADRPCIDRKFKVSNVMHYIVLMTSDDPDLIPPLSLLK